MKTLNVHLQPELSPGLDVAASLEHLQGVAPATAHQGDDNGPYLNVNFRAADLRPVWSAVRDLLRADTALAACAVACCQGEHGWDDYLLLHHFDPSEPLDELG